MGPSESVSYVKLISSASRSGWMLRSILSMPLAMRSVIPPAWRPRTLAATNVPCAPIFAASPAE